MKKKNISIIGNKTRISLEMTSRQIELEAIQLKDNMIWIKTLIEKEKYFLSDIGVKIC